MADIRETVLLYPGRSGLVYSPEALIEAAEKYRTNPGKLQVTHPSDKALCGTLLSIRVNGGNLEGVVELHPVPRSQNPAGN